MNALLNTGRTLIFIFSLTTTLLTAQNLTQTIRGIVQDADSEYPLIGATISVIGVEPMIATTTDVDGDFKLTEVPIGRQSLEIRYLGYEVGYMSNIVVTSGKELVLTISLKESAQILDEVVVKASDEKQQPLNEMASVSARSFSVEENSTICSCFVGPRKNGTKLCRCDVFRG